MSDNEDKKEIKVYLNNPNLKAAGVHIEFEPWQVQEMIKCFNDPIYFIETYVKIVHIDKGLVPFKLYPFQKKMVDLTMNNRYVLLKLPRQSGKSTVTAACILHYMLFQEHKTVAILANKAPTAREILGRIQLMYEHLPLWLQQGIKTWNKGSFSLGNGCKIIAASTSSSAIRGTSISWLVLDEFAFVPPNQATEFFESVYPTISSGQESKVSIFSTPKGMNHFYKMWVEATEGRSEFKPFEIHWSEVPGRDELWKEKTITNIGQESWDQEFEAQFLGSANTLISSMALRNLVHKEPIAISSSLRIFEQPKEDHVYFLSVDCSRGAGIDYSVIQITDITEYPFKQVGMFRDNKTNHYLLPRITVEIAKKYNQAYILVEINDIGEAVADSIYFDEEYENLLTTGESKGKIALGSWRNGRNGVRTTKSTKREGCSVIKALIESNKYLVTDFTTINEFSTFISKNNSYEADDLCHDDTVMSLVVFAWATGQEYFKEIMQKDFRKTFIEESCEEMMEELSPLGFFEGFDDQDKGEWRLAE